MIFATLYHTNLAGVPSPICGTDSFIKLDARRTLSSHLETCRALAAKRKAVGFMIESGRINDYQQSNAILWRENV